MDDNQQAENKRLLEALLNNDGQVIGETLVGLRSRAVGMAYRYELDDPQDVASRAIEGTLVKIPKVDWETTPRNRNFKGYLYRMVQREVIDQARQKQELFTHISKKKAAKERLYTPPSDDDEGDRALDWHGVWSREAAKPSPGGATEHRVIKALRSFLLSEEGSLGEEQYRESLDLVENLPYVAKRRVSKYLMGYSMVEIAYQEYCTKQAVSKIISPLFFIWEWDREHIKRVRKLWLISALRDIREQARRLAYRQGRGYYDDDAYIKHLHRIVTEDSRTKLYFHDLTQEGAVALHRFIIRVDF